MSLAREVDLYRPSMAVMRSHESKDFLGGVIASLSIPWGFNKGDEDLGGYHLVWPRDLVETAFGFLAAGAEPDALRVLRYLEATQEADGRWAQNMWLDGRPYWSGMQMDETAFPILLVDVMRRHSPICSGQSPALVGRWSVVRPASSFATARSPSRIAGKKTQATPLSPSLSKSPACSPPPIWPTRWDSQTSPPTCVRRPIAGTTISSAGCMPKTATWRASLAWKATTCGSRRPTPTAQLRRWKASSP